MAWLDRGGEIGALYFVLTCVAVGGCGCLCEIFGEQKRKGKIKNRHPETTILAASVADSLPALASDPLSLPMRHGVNPLSASGGGRLLLAFLISINDKPTVEVRDALCERGVHCCKRDVEGWRQPAARLYTSPRGVQPLGPLRP